MATPLVTSAATNNDDLEDKVICSCSGTKRSRIEALFKKGYDIDAISQWTGAISGCGGCEWDISGLLIALTKEAELADNTQSFEKS